MAKKNCAAQLAAEAARCSLIRNPDRRNACVYRAFDKYAGCAMGEVSGPTGKSTKIILGAVRGLLKPLERGKS
jgi:hypothetical protein